MENMLMLFDRDEVEDDWTEVATIVVAVAVVEDVGRDFDGPAPGVSDRPSRQRLA